MIACIFDPGSCVPEWAKLIWAYWDSLLLILFAGMAIGALMGWKGLAIALSGGLVLFLAKRGASDPAWETGEDRIWQGGKPMPGSIEKFGGIPKRRVVNRTAKRTFDPDTNTWK
jgi:hypothetical protein